MFGAAHRGCQTESEKCLQYKITETGISNGSGEEAGNFFHQELLLPIDFGGHIHVIPHIMYRLPHRKFRKSEIRCYK